ncbi:MAG: hypothetical protein L3J36_11100 [Rhodobacteraceae bacterium]|nr:hypothetical protein [Paracoccaceae bacterium]
MLGRIPGAAARGTMVAFLVAFPSMLLPGVSNTAIEMGALLALFAALLTFVEYYSNYPSFVEFRDAPPLNRIRFVALFTTVLILTLMGKHAYSPTNLTALLSGFGAIIGDGLDFPYSPVRLVTLMLPDFASAEMIAMVRRAAGVSYVIGLITIAVFLFAVHIRGWPTRVGAFNVWVNLPLFDPTTGGDVVYRLQRDGRINMIFGFLLPFIIPAVIKIYSDFGDPVMLTNPQTLIWTMSAWSFLPASMIMRGVAMMRIAGLIEDKRRRAYANAQALQTA